MCEVSFIDILPKNVVSVTMNHIFYVMQECIVMSIDRKAKFPMHISASFLYYSPMSVVGGSQDDSQDESLNQAGEEPNASDAEQQWPKVVRSMWENMEK